MPVLEKKKSLKPVSSTFTVRNKQTKKIEEKIKPDVSKRSEWMSIGKEKRKKKKEINATKNGFFENVNKIDKLLS